MKCDLLRIKNNVFFLFKNNFMLKNNINFLYGNQITINLNTGLTFKLCVDVHTKLFLIYSINSFVKKRNT